MFDAREVGLRAQKKLASRMASSKGVARLLIDGATASLLDNVYALARAHAPSRKEAEKVVKNIIKVVLKLGLLVRSGQLDAEELRTAEHLRRRFRATAMAVVSFHEVAFSYDRTFLVGALQECRCLVLGLVRRHLTEKSVWRVEHVFAFFCAPPLLDAVFAPHPSPLLHHIVGDLHALLDQGAL